MTIYISLSIHEAKYGKHTGTFPDLKWIYFSSNSTVQVGQPDQSLIQGMCGWWSEHPYL